VIQAGELLPSKCEVLSTMKKMCKNNTYVLWLLKRLNSVGYSYSESTNQIENTGGKAASELNGWTQT
jgi:hypothetical protein